MNLSSMNVSGSYVITGSRTVTHESLIQDIPSVTLMRMDEFCDTFTDGYPVETLPNFLKVGQTFNKKDVEVLAPYIQPVIGAYKIFSITRIDKDFFELSYE